MLPTATLLRLLMAALVTLALHPLSHAMPSTPPETDDPFLWLENVTSPRSMARCTVSRTRRASGNGFST